ncbi:MAG: UDP-N-acetylmuramoyl-L-alanyl-D-glutamate--2,6-diaminopimelate ligase [Clostridiales bacterium]|nr:UDP-N-acetylmuramoyl-L-alanyl-D-glutamate--2,6-diaminopimelate ligase [Clostridiales bacterium]
MKLSTLLKGVKTVSEYNNPSIMDGNATAIVSNSNELVDGCVFVCIKGMRFDGHTKAEEAIKMGALAVVVERDLGIDRQIIVENTREALSILASNFYGKPGSKLKLIGVTGTNGKTTTTTIIKHILEHCGYKVGQVSTIEHDTGDEIIPAVNGTPEPLELQMLLAKMVENGCEYAVMEPSSQALEQRRVHGEHFIASGFTNFTQDHLDYHGNMENYFLAKRMLCDISDFTIVNFDDDAGRRLLKDDGIRTFSFSTNEKYGLNASANGESSGEIDFIGDNIKISSDGGSYWICFEEKSYPVRFSLLGEYNVANTLLAAAICYKIGMPIRKIIDAIATCKGVKGRSEVIPTGRDFTVICDYAHTPDGLENILPSVREYARGRVICLFGCGGNRDRTKRPQMGRAAALNADHLIITSDNPRDEDPQAIIEDILTGIKDIDIPHDIVVDRKEAIYHSLRIARDGDVIVLAGKGHEDYLILEDDLHIHFDEREIVRDALLELFPD